MNRHLTQFFDKSASYDEVLDEDDAAGLVDRFALQHRLPSGKSVLELFLASRPDLSAADLDMLRAWGDVAEGVFELRSRDQDAVLLLNLLDDLEYRTYSNMGPAAFRPVPKGGFLIARLVPISPVPGAWLVSGYMSVFPKSSAAQVAQLAVRLSATDPELVFRNPDKLEQGWKQMREDRAAFIEFFGSDELVLPPAEAKNRLSAYYRRQTAATVQSERRKRRSVPDDDPFAFEFPAELAEADTMGIIYDETDGINFYGDYGMLRDLFADPALAADKQHANVLRGYLASDSVGPLPFRRLAAAHPETVDAVFRKVLRKPSFTWTEHGEALLRRHKPWYYEQERRPGVSVVGTRLAELAALR
jgi:hypothetical protein